MTNAVYNKESTARILVVFTVDCYHAMMINNVILNTPRKKERLMELNE